uniref:RING-type domain-containing protein n=1 Tax=Oncorhynchus mykiss TaxID=8022 RepID=A0A8C7Q3X0_ONCMY
MATSSSLLSEEQLLCSICLDLFTEPVTTPCGHNFCKACIRQYWDSNDLCLCPMCKEKFHRKPELRINTFISEMAAQFRKSVEVKATSSRDQCPVQPLEVPCDICTGMKLKALKSCLVKKEAQREISNSVQVFTDLVRSIEKIQAELIEMFEENQKAAERQAEGLIKDLKQEINDLKKRSTKLEYFPSLSVSQLEEALMREVRKLCDAELMRIQLYTVDVTLDPDTAYPKLTLSEDWKQVRHEGTLKKLSDNPERFDYICCVLGKKGFFSGRFYYEVTVQGKTKWDLGVARESINRKGKIMLKPQNGYWTVVPRNGNEYKANAGHPVTLSLRKKPQKVGVFVDYEEGQV